MEIRLAGAGDAPAIARLINRAFAVEVFFVSGERISPAEVERHLERGAFHVAQTGVAGNGKESRLAGCVYTELGDGDTAYLGLLAVDPEAQGTGIGRRLMARAEEHCRAAGSRRIDIQVAHLRSELPPWYRRLGYREIGTRPFSDPERLLRPCHFVVMSKSLTSDGTSAG